MPRVLFWTVLLVSAALLAVVATDRLVGARGASVTEAPAAIGIAGYDHAVRPSGELLTALRAGEVGRIDSSHRSPRERRIGEELETLNTWVFERLVHGPSRPNTVGQNWLAWGLGQADGDDRWVADPDYGLVFGGTLLRLCEADGLGEARRRVREAGHGPRNQDAYIAALRNRRHHRVIAGARLSPRLASIEIALDVLAWLLPAATLIALALVRLRRAAWVQGAFPSVSRPHPVPWTAGPRSSPDGRAPGARRGWIR